MNSSVTIRCFRAVSNVWSGASDGKKVFHRIGGVLLTPVVRICRQEQRDHSTEADAKRVHVQENRIKVELRAHPIDDAVSLAWPSSTIVADDETNDLELIGDIGAEYREGQRDEKLAVDVGMQRCVASPPACRREGHIRSVLFGVERCRRCYPWCVTGDEICCCLGFRKPLHTVEVVVKDCVVVREGFKCPIDWGKCSCAVSNMLTAVGTRQIWTSEQPQTCSVPALVHRK